MNRQDKHDLKMMLKLTPVLLLLAWLTMKLITGFPVFIQNTQNRVMKKVDKAIKKKAGEVKDDYEKDQREKERRSEKK